MWVKGVGNLHKWVVDRDDKHLTGVIQRRVVDVAGHVGAGARRACGSEDHLSATGTGTWRRTMVAETFGSVLKAAGTPTITPLP